MNPLYLSIIVCTYNRDKYLPKCLDHLAGQSAPPESFEVIVIDNNSTDRTAEICKEFQQSRPHIKFKYCLETRQGLSFSRNHGLSQANAALVSYIDDDAFAHPNYALNLIKYFKEHPQVDAVGGKITPVYEGTPPIWMSRYLLPLVAALDMGQHPKPFRGQKFPIGANMALRTSGLAELGDFNVDLGRKGEFLGSGEEKDLFYRMRKAKRTIHYVPSVQVSHSIAEVRTTESYIKKMAEGIGKSEALRSKNAGIAARFSKWLEEFFKIGATVILALYFTLTLNWPKAKMLVKFRLWVLDSFIKG